MTNCHKDHFELDRLSDEIELEPQLVVPLIYGSMTMTDLMSVVDSAGYADEFPDGLIYLAYSDTVVNIMADTMVDIPDKFYQELYLETDNDIPAWLPVAIDDTVTFPRSEIVAFELDGNDRIDSIVVKDGRIKIEVESSFKHKGYLTISSNQILDKNRKPFSTTIEIDDLSGGFIDSVIFSSDGFCIEPFVQNDTNMIQIDFDLALINSGNPINPDEQCVIKTSFLDLYFYGVYGYIDSRDLIDETGSVDIPLYADNPDLASLIFKDPRINLSTSSSVGIPFEVEFDSVIATAADGTEETLILDGGNLLNILAPKLDRIGDTVNTYIPINNTNSNIQDFLAIGPAGISYSVKGRTEPGTGDETHFILDISKFLLELEFLLPLDFKSSGFSLQDTLEFELGEDGIDTSLVKFAQVNMTTVNKLPIELMLQVYLLDETYAVIDSVFGADAVLLGASVVDTEGKLVQDTEETNSVIFPADKLGRLENVSYMLVEARMITSSGGEQFVKLYSHYSLDFKITMLANFRINTRELN